MSEPAVPETAVAATAPVDAIVAGNQALSELAERHGMTFLAMYPTHITTAVLEAALPALWSHFFATSHDVKLMIEAARRAGREEGVKAERVRHLAVVNTLLNCRVADRPCRHCEKAVDGLIGSAERYDTDPPHTHDTDEQADICPICFPPDGPTASQPRLLEGDTDGK